MSANEVKWTKHIYGGLARKTKLCPNRHLPEKNCIYFQFIPDSNTGKPNCVFAHCVEDLRVPQQCHNGESCPHLKKASGCMFTHPGHPRRTTFDPEAFKVDKKDKQRTRGAIRSTAQQGWQAPRSLVWDRSATKGTRPSFPSHRFINPLPKYGIPPTINKHIDVVGVSLHRFTVISKLKEEAVKMLGDVCDCWSELRESSYGTVLDTLLWLEEAQMLVDIRMYDLIGITLRYDNRMVKIDVPSLAEDRPSVLRGDAVFAKPHGKEHPVHKGFVHFVNLDSIVVSFHESFQPGLYDVHFTVTRTQWKIMHRAIRGLCPHLQKAFCVREAGRHSASLVRDEGIDQENEMVRVLNPQQRKAVATVVSKPSMPVLVFGPPGTGKTRTMVHMVGLILSTQPQAKILITTPSNNAADLVCQRIASLLKLSPHEMLRINGFMRMKNKIAHADEILPFCYWSPEMKCFDIPSLEETLSFRVIISTCVSAGYLSSIGMPRESFDFIFIDESGEALEPEVLVPLQLAGPKTVVALFGDPKQLGPIVRSPIALEYKLDRSLLERLAQSASCPSVQLVHSYRAHPSLLSIYSSMFYDSILVSSPDTPSDTNACIGWSRLPNPKVPLLFLHVDGQERRERDSPSWFNQAEIEAIKEIAERLLADGHAPTEMGIIAPYRKQGSKIKSWIHNQRPRFDGIKVGSVEAFQGDERRIILLTTVRSREREMILGNDRIFRLGFLHNQKRLNVAISRAQALLVVVGNAELLHGADPHWANFIRQCMSLGAYEGPDLKAEEFKDGEAVQSEFELIEDHGMNDDAAWRADF